MASSPPRVLHLIPWLSLGGATGLVIGLADRLRAHGYDVEIATGSRTEAGLTMADQVRALGIPVHFVDSFLRDPHPLTDLRALRDLTRFLRDGRYDIVHGHGTKALLLGTWAARRAGIRHTVWHAHGWGFHDHSSGLMRGAVVLAHRLIARTVSRVAAVSEATKRIGLEAAIGREDDYRVIYEAVDLDRFAAPPLAPRAAKERLGLDPDTPVVGTLARLSDQKCPLDLVEAAAVVLRERPDTRFLIVGDGPLREATVRRIRELGIEGQVTLPGARLDVPEVLAAMDIFALASLWEGFPICYLEAMAFAIPVVGTDVGGSAEAVCDGQTGFIVPPRRPGDMADRILQLLRDESLRRRMGEAGRRVVLQYGYDRLLRDVSALYGELLNGAAPG